jgi:ankyrin repeat protein
MKKPTQSSAKAGSSDLFETVMSGRVADVKRLVQAGANVNKRKSDGFTPLMLAASRGDEKLTEYLIRQGADTNLRNEIGQTALMIAALGGHKTIIEQLVMAGADISAIDKEGRNAIAWAASRGDFPEVVSTLAVLGADYDAPDTQGMTPLMRAALLGYSGVVGALLTVGSDETIKFKGKTAYDMASDKGHEEVCKTITAILKNRPKGHRL